jgi:excisionase family DNA binding protein
VPELEPHYTVAEVAEGLRVCTRTIIARIKSGRLPALNLGTARRADFRIPLAALAALGFTPPPSLSEAKAARRRAGRRPKFVPLLRVG